MISSCPVTVTATRHTQLIIHNPHYGQAAHHHHHHHQCSTRDASPRLRLIQLLQFSPATQVKQKITPTAPPSSVRVVFYSPFNAGAAFNYII